MIFVHKDPHCALNPVWFQNKSYLHNQYSPTSVIPTETSTSIFKSSLYYVTQYIIHVPETDIIIVVVIIVNSANWLTLFNILNITWCWQDSPCFSIPACSKKMAKSFKLLDTTLDYNIWNRNECKYPVHFLTSMLNECNDEIYLPYFFC